MFSTLRTLVNGANRRAETKLRAQFSIELIEEKIAEAQCNLKSAKGTLVALTQKQRAEARQVASLETQIEDLTSRAKAALDGGREDLALTAAEGIANLENELTLRLNTVARLDSRILRLRTSVEAASRRILDLKQGAIAARATRSEHIMQAKLASSLGAQPLEEAEDLIAQVLNEEDPFEASEILQEINTSLTPQNVAERLADAGFGPAQKSRAEDVLARLKD